MLAVVVVPVLIMLVACLLERFEARVTAEPPRRVPRAPRPGAAPAQTAAPAEDAPARPARHLSLVPATAVEDEGLRKAS